MIFFSIFITIYVYEQKNALKNRIYPNVYIDNVNFGRKSVNDLEKYFQDKNRALADRTIKIVFGRDEIATFSAQALKLNYDIQTLKEQSLLIGRTPSRVANMYQSMMTILDLGRFDLTSNLNYDLAEAHEFLTLLEEKYNRDSEDALFNVVEGRVVAFKIEKNGLKIDRAKALKDLNVILSEIKVNPSKTFTLIVDSSLIKPKISLSSINEFGIVEKIGEGKSNFSGSIPTRIHNVKLATSKFKGVLIPKDEIFSFNKIVGDISSSTGYQPAYIIKQGRTVLGDGGGVCQVSTTLFRAALNSGLPIVERNAHAYRVHYYENDSKPGFDATVYAPSVDFKFKNDTAAYILIQTTIEGNELTFSLYGKKDTRKVEISEGKIWDLQPAPGAVYQDDPTLKRGVTKQVDWSVGGAKASFHYKVTKDDVITQDRDFFSNFRPWQAVYLVGTGDF